MTAVVRSVVSTRNPFARRVSSGQHMCGLEEEKTTMDETPVG